MQRIRNDFPQFQTVRIWNNQTRYNADGQYPDFAKPACFVEVLNGVSWDALPGGITSADLGFVFHIVHEYYDAQDGTFEQDLPVFQLRNAIVKAFTLYKPTGCGPMTLVTDEQDANHTNIYEYMVGFVTHFLDDTGAPTTIDATMPGTLEVNGQYVDPKNYIKLNVT